MPYVACCAQDTDGHNSKPHSVWALNHLARVIPVMQEHWIHEQLQTLTLQQEAKAALSDIEMYLDSEQVHGDTSEQRATSPGSPLARKFSAPQRHFTHLTEQVAGAVETKLQTLFEKSSPTRFDEGQAVLVDFTDKATIVKVYKGDDGLTYDVKYDNDGSVETGVRARYVSLPEESASPPEPAMFRQLSHPVTQNELESVTQNEYDSMGTTWSSSEGGTSLNLFS